MIAFNVIDNAKVCPLSTSISSFMAGASLLKLGNLNRRATPATPARKSKTTTTEAAHG